MNLIITSCSLLYLLLLTLRFKITSQNPIGVSIHNPVDDVIMAFERPLWETGLTIKSPYYVGKDNRRFKRFSGGTPSKDPFVAAIHRGDETTRIHPHSPIFFHGATNAHLTREQLIWKKIYALLRRRSNDNVLQQTMTSTLTNEQLIKCLEGKPITETGSSLSALCQENLNVPKPDFPASFEGNHIHNTGPRGGFDGHPSVPNNHEQPRLRFPPNSNGHLHSVHHSLHTQHIPNRPPTYDDHYRIPHSPVTPTFPTSSHSHHHSTSHGHTAHTHRIPTLPSTFDDRYHIPHSHANPRGHHH